MICRYCGKQIGVLRKFTDSKFCSDKHRESYEREFEKLVLDRLDTVLGAGRQPAEPVVEPAQTVPSPPLPLATLVPAPPQALAGPTASTSKGTVPFPCRPLLFPSRPLLGDGAPQRSLGPQEAQISLAPQVPMKLRVATETVRFRLSGPKQSGPERFSIYRPQFTALGAGLQLTEASFASVPVSQAVSNARSAEAVAFESAAHRCLTMPGSRVTLSPKLQEPSFPKPALSTPYPAAEFRCAGAFNFWSLCGTPDMPRLGGAASVLMLLSPNEAHPNRRRKLDLEIATGNLRRGGSRIGHSRSRSVFPRSRPLISEGTRIPVLAGPLKEQLEALGPVASGIYLARLDPLFPGANCKWLADLDPADIGAIAQPLGGAAPQSRSNPVLPVETIQPGALQHWMRGNSRYLGSILPVDHESAPLVQVEPLWSISAPGLRKRGREPIADSFLRIIPLSVSLSPTLLQIENARIGSWPPHGFRRHTPPCLVKMAMAGAVFFVMFQAYSAGGAHRIESEWNAARQAIQGRAAMELEEDFHYGLGAWQGGLDLAKNWSYGDSGEAWPAQLGLFSPSIALTDYRLEFSTLIERKGVGWVFRAADRQNYYAMKVILLKDKYPRSAAIVRYPVIAGKEGQRVQAYIPLYVSPDAEYRVHLDVKGDHFTTYIQGQVVDHWSDASLKSGGVGFFCDKGERARLLRVRVSHQNDSLGRLCAFVAPNYPQLEQRGTKR